MIGKVEHGTWSSNGKTGLRINFVGSDQSGKINGVAFSNVDHLSKLYGHENSVASASQSLVLQNARNPTEVTSRVLSCILWIKASFLKPELN